MTKRGFRGKIIQTQNLKGGLCVNQVNGRYRENVRVGSSKEKERVDPGREREA